MSRSSGFAYSSIYGTPSVSISFFFLRCKTKISFSLQKLSFFHYTRTQKLFTYMTDIPTSRSWKDVRKTLNTIVTSNLFDSRYRNYFPRETIKKHSSQQATTRTRDEKGCNPSGDQIIYPESEFRSGRTPRNVTGTDSCPSRRCNHPIRSSLAKAGPVPGNRFST